MKILIVEDSYLRQDNYCDCFDPMISRGETIEYTFVVSFDEFVEVYESVQPDVVWTDHRLVGVKNGADVAWWMENNHPEIHCISVSTFHEMGYPPWVKHLGKHFSIRKLYVGTKSWLETGIVPEWHDL